MLKSPQLKLRAFLFLGSALSPRLARILDQRLDELRHQPCNRALAPEPLGLRPNTYPPETLTKPLHDKTKLETRAFRSV